MGKINISPLIVMVLSFLLGTPFEAVANDVKQIIATGKADIQSLEDLVLHALQVAENYWPPGSQILKDLEDIILLLDRTVKHFQALPK